MMSKDIENIIIDQLIVYEPEFVGLFGSYLDPDRSPRDIDILVKFKKQLSLLQLLRLENRLSDLLKIKADLVTEGALKNNRVKENIQKNLRIIYKA